MKTKWLTIGAALGIGAVMIFVSGFSAMAHSSGYDVYKTALKNNMSVSSVSNTGKITVTDNGTKVLGGDLYAKFNREQNTMSVALKLSNGTEEHTMEAFKQNNQIIFKDDKSDVYRQMDMGESKWRHDGATSGPPKVMETVIDALMGNLKEMATVKDASDGGKIASLHASGSQIPAIVNHVGSMAVSHLGDRGRWSDTEGANPHAFANIPENLPKLTENIKVQQLNLDAKISPDLYLEHQTGEIMITGKDESGVQHNLVITLDFTLSDFNQTVPETVDLTGKLVEVVQPKARKGPWHR